MERLNTVAIPGMIGKRRPEQIAQASNWDGIPDGSEQAASMNTIHVVPKNGSTETRVNPLDPADGTDESWRNNPNKPWGTVIPAGRQL